jgi:hypothetical protein
MAISNRPSRRIRVIGWTLSAVTNSTAAAAGCIVRMTSAAFRLTDVRWGPSTANGSPAEPVETASST